MYAQYAIACFIMAFHRDKYCKGKPEMLEQVSVVPKARFVPFYTLNRSTHPLDYAWSCYTPF